jgi:2-methylisocitrate lyase-like PEP mutase family enzyme
VSVLAERAATLRELHRPGDPVVLPNAWDPPSARRLAATGAAALATTSVGVAEALGYEDGERTPPAEMLAAVGRIARAVELPVTADLEAGYGLGPDDLVSGCSTRGRWASTSRTPTTRRASWPTRTRTPSAWPQ